MLPKRNILTTDDLDRSSPVVVLPNFEVVFELLCLKPFFSQKQSPLKSSKTVPKILSRPGFEPGVLLPHRNVLSTRRSGQIDSSVGLV